jgi:DNA-directed RNA polymerase subunit K/omega
MSISTKESRIVKEVNENLGITSVTESASNRTDSIINLATPVQTGGATNKQKSDTSRTEKNETKKSDAEEKKVKKSKSTSDISKGKKSSKVITVFDDLDYREVLLNYDPKKNKTRPIMTQDEIALILGKRATMIQYRAKPNIEIKPGMDETDIAKEELRQKKIPFLIQRPIGDGYEIWKIKDLKIKEL